MADNRFNFDGGTNVISDDDNFVLDHTPTSGEVLVLDGDETDENLACDENLVCDGAGGGLRIEDAYAGVFDAATFDVSLGDQGLDCTGGAAATLDLGSGTWTVTGGDFNINGISSLVWGTSHVVLEGVGNLDYENVSRLYDLTIAAGATTTIVAAIFAQIRVLNSLTIGGTLTDTNSPNLWVQNSLVMEDNSTLDIHFTDLAGVGTFTRGVNTTITAGGSFKLRGASTIAAGEYDTPSLTLRGSATITPAAGSITTTGELQCDAGSGAITLDLSANDPSVTIGGDLRFTLSSANDVIILPGANGLNVEGDVIDELSSTGILVANDCPLTLSGTSSVDIAFSGGEFGAVEIDKAAGTVTAQDTWACSSLTGTDGDLNLNGQTLTTSGAVSFASGFTVADPVGSTINCDTISFDGQDLSVASAAWDINATSLGSVATGTTFKDCQFVGPGGAKLDATDGTNTNAGGNNGIDFGVIAFGAFRGIFSPVFVGAFG